MAESTKFLIKSLAIKKQVNMVLQSPNFFLLLHNLGEYANFSLNRESLLWLPILNGSTGKLMG